MTAAVGVEHGFERKALLGAALRMLANESEIADRAAAEQPHELGCVLARVVNEIGQDVGVARLGERRDLREHRRAQLVGYGGAAAGDRADGRGRETARGERAERGAQSSKTVGHRLWSLHSDGMRT